MVFWPLLDGILRVSLFVYFAVCSSHCSCLVCGRGKKHKGSEIEGSLAYVIFNPNGAYISAQTWRGTVTRSSSKTGFRWWITDRRLRRTQLATAVERGQLCHTRTVFPAGAYERQRFHASLSACCFVSAWYMSGLCARERGIKAGDILPVRRCKIRPLVLKPGTCVLSSPAERIV